MLVDWIPKVKLLIKTSTLLLILIGKAQKFPQIYNYSFPTISDFMIYDYELHS